MTARTMRTALTVVLVGSCAFAASAEVVVGRFQFVSAVTAMSRETAGIMRMTLEAPKAVDVSDKDASRLSLLFDIRVTRADGACGADSLKLVQGGGVSMTDPAGNEVFRAVPPRGLRCALRDYGAERSGLARFSRRFLREIGCEVLGV